MEAKELAQIFREVGPNQTLGSALKDIADRLEKPCCSHAWGDVFQRRHDLGHYIHLIQCKKCGEVHVDLNTGTNKERDWVCIIPGRRSDDRND